MKIRTDRVNVSHHSIELNNGEVIEFEITSARSLVGDLDGECDSLALKLTFNQPHEKYGMECVGAITTILGGYGDKNMDMEAFTKRLGKFFMEGLSD